MRKEEVFIIFFHLALAETFFQRTGKQKRCNKTNTY